MSSFLLIYYINSFPNIKIASYLDMRLFVLFYCISLIACAFADYVSFTSITFK